MAVKEQDPKTQVKKIQKPLVKLNSLFNDIMDTLSPSNTSVRDKELNDLTKEIDDVVFQEVKNLTKFTGDDISTFLVKMFNEQEAGNNYGIKDIEDLFESESAGIFSFFQERYRNQNLLYEDLNLITSQLYELKEALYATRDAIVSSDDMSHTVSRTLKFKNSADDNMDKTSYIGIIETMEKEFKLLSKIKNHIVPNTLQYGRYYVYTVPYAKLFEKHYQRKVKDQMKTRVTNEGSLGVALESVTEDFAKTFKSDHNITSITNKDVAKSFNSIMENIEVYNEELAIPSLESSSELSDLVEFKFEKQVAKAVKEQEKRSKVKVNDGTVDIKDTELDFSNVKECYVKLIDPRKIIPIKILDETIGYYYVHEVDTKVAKSPFTTNIKLTPGSQANAKDMESAFLTKITDKIVKAFDKKFLENNVKFKELILNSLIYNDVYKKQLKFQFIPVDYITEFSVNQDEEGQGTSIILPSLFYAKLYLALLIFKMITIISKSNDQKVYYVKSSGIDQDVANKIQSVARSIKDKQINFMDLMNYNSMVSKIGAAKDVFMPIGRSGEKGIEFDILSGQDVQLNTELMELLRTAFINATGVPSVIMNYINEADYAKTLVMANMKFLGRVVSFQMDFNPGITELYKKILSFSTSLPPEVIEEFEFTLATPKTLNTTNLTDLINNADQVIQYMIKSMTGEQAEQSEDANLLKDILYKKYSRDLLPMIPWDMAEKLLKEAKVELENKKALKKAEEDSSSDV